jgi:hypothetical protein
MSTDDTARTAARRASSNGHTKVDERNGEARRPSIPQLVGMLSQAVTEQVAKRIPTADLDERDPDYIRENLPGAWMLASFYFRADVKGLHHIPSEGPVLLVGNHSGGNLTPDTTVFTLAFTTYFGVERKFYQLAHNLVLAMPMLSFLRKYGTVAAGRSNARKALRTGAAVLPVFALPLAGGRYKLIYERPVPPPREDSPDAIREFTQRCTDVLEMYVRRHPELWLWMHRRWRDDANRRPRT